MYERPGWTLTFLGLIATIACLSSQPVAAETTDAGTVADALLEAVGAEPATCWSENVAVSFERHCGIFPGDMEQFKKRWKRAMRGREELSATLTKGGEWKKTSSKTLCYRDYELFGRWLRILYVRASEQLGKIEVHYSPEGSAEAPSADGPLIAGIGEVSKPVLIQASKVAPEYPELARVTRSEGHVIMQAVILRDGTVADLEILRAVPIGLGMLDAAVEAVSQWRYEPAKLNGEPVDVYFTVFVEFKLD